jgi:cytochrome P450
VVPGRRADRAAGVGESTVAVADELYWDPFDHALHWDSHPVWRRMREEAPLYRNDRHDFWALTRFGDVLDALVDTSTYSSAQGDIIELIRGGPIPEYMRSMIFIDPPEHTILRQLVSRAFTPRRVAEIEIRTRELVRGVLDRYVGAGGFDYVEDFGARVPGMVIAALLGTPESELERIRHLTDESLARDEAGNMVHDRGRELLGEYFAECLAERRARLGRGQPTDDMMSALAAAEITDLDGNRRTLTDDEAVSFIHLLSAAGNETVARFTGWAAATLAQFPAERAKLAARPDLIARGVEEILRYEPPSMSLARVATREVTWYGETLPAGSVVVLVTAATGRDPRKFADPDRLDVERTIDRHLSFGFGAHVCLGASLARLEGRVMLEETLARFPEWDVDWDAVDIVHTGSAVRGYARLPIRTG